MKEKICGGIKMEYYGEKPKKFTKEWWPYFWDYYKWHTIAIIFVVVSVVWTAVDIITQEKYDGSLVTVGEVVLTDELSDELKKNVSVAVDDIDGNGTKSVLVEQLAFSDNDVDVQYSSAMKMKYELKLQTDESFAFIMDKTQLERSLSSSDTQGCFATVTEWLTEDINKEDMFEYDKKPYAVSLKNSKLFKDMGLNGENVYAVLRYNYKSDKEELNSQFENAKKILNALLKSE